MPKPLTEYFWIVDGHNLVLNVPELTRLYNFESKKAARDAAETRLAELASVSPNAVQLVFDGDVFPGGQPGRGESGKLSVCFVDPPAEADDWIVQLARQESDAGQPVAVATSDRGLLARLAGSQPIHRMAVDAFWREMGRVVRQGGPTARVEKPQPQSSSPAELVALEAAMTRPIPDEKHTRRRAPGDAAAPANMRGAQGGGRAAHDTRGPRDARTPEITPAPASSAAPAMAPGPPKRPEPPPPPPPKDWRAEIEEKKERGRQRQLKRLERRKGS
ncbi:MAG: NYN domain-containing protein [bacterium]